MSGDPSTTSPLTPGYRLDRYELLCPIADGGMASVWVARLRAKHGFEKLVAIKTILPKHAEDLRFQQMFLDEARIASRIDHANVAHVLDLGDEHGVLYLVMEWIDGDSLSKLQRAVKASGAQIPLGVSMRIVADACAGLHAAHELSDREGHNLGVVHRDVSPQNILLDSRGVVKVIDFGIAKARDRISGETSSGSLKGKIQFMAPEQAVGKAIDRRADVWSTGSVLYTLLAGDPPYEDANQYATLHRIASGERPPPLPRHVPQEVAAIVDRALSFEPADRFATMADMQAAIESAIDEHSMPATPRDVAELASVFLSTRADQRRKAIGLAVSAAAERDRVAKILVMPPPDSVPSATSGRRESARMQIATIPDVPPVPLSEASSPSLRTLGPASMPSLPPAPRSKVGGRVALAALALTAAVLLFALGRVTTTTTPPTKNAAVVAVPDAPPPPAATADLPPPEPAASVTAPPVVPAIPPAPAPAAAPPSHPAPRKSPPHVAPPPAPSAAASSSTTMPRRRVDDGF